MAAYILNKLLSNWCIWHRTISPDLISVTEQDSKTTVAKYRPLSSPSLSLTPTSRNMLLFFLKLDKNHVMENDETSLKTNANVISICLCVCTLCCVVRIIDDHTASLYLSSFFLFRGLPRNGLFCLCGPISMSMGGAWGLFLFKYSDFLWLHV